MYPQIHHTKQLYVFILLLLWLATAPSWPVGAVQLTITTYINAVAWSPDGSMIAVGKGTPSCEADASLYTIQILNAATRQVVQNLAGSTCGVTSIDWSPDGMKLAAASLDGWGLRVWNVQTGQLLMTVQRGGQGVTSVRWKPDESQLIIGTVSNGAGIIDPATGEGISAPPIGGTTFDWSPDGSKLVSGSYYENLVYIADMVTGQKIMALTGHTGTLGTVDWSPDGSKLVSAGADDTIRLWNASSGELLLTINAANVGQVRWSPDSQKIAASSIDAIVQVWDAATGQLLNTFSYPGRVQTVDWSPDGSQVVYGGYGVNGQAPQLEISDIGGGTPTPIPTNTPTATPMPIPISPTGTGLRGG